MHTLCVRRLSVRDENLAAGQAVNCYSECSYLAVTAVTINRIGAKREQSASWTVIVKITIWYASQLNTILVRFVYK